MKHERTPALLFFLPFWNRFVFPIKDTKIGRKDDLETKLVCKNTVFGTKRQLGIGVLQSFCIHGACVLQFCFLESDKVPWFTIKAPQKCVVGS